MLCSKREKSTLGKTKIKLRSRKEKKLVCDLVAKGPTREESSLRQMLKAKFPSQAHTKRPKMRETKEPPSCVHGFLHCSTFYVSTNIVLAMVFITFKNRAREPVLSKCGFVFKNAAPAIFYNPIKGPHVVIRLRAVA